MGAVVTDILDKDPLALADAAHALVQTDAGRAAVIAERALTFAREQGEPEAEVAALHALGFARRELGDPRAVRTLRAAVRVGERNGLTRRAALARRPLAVYLAYQGAIGPALREIDAACAALDAHELARSEVFRIAVLHLAGRAPATLAPSNQALLTLRREGDVIWEARLLKNRGLLFAERGNAAAAEPDLIRARDLYAALGATEASLGTEIELARLALTRGDLPSCLARVDAIDRAGVPPNQSAGLALLRAQALIAGRLTSEAWEALGHAQAIWQRARIHDPELLLRIVQLNLLAGDPATAWALATRARRSFAAQRRHVYSARAVGLSLAASIAAGTVRPSAVLSGRRAVATLAAAGWREEALRVRLLVARAAIELGSPRVARQELAACSSLRRRGPVADRIDAWHVEALVRLHAGDCAAAARGARSGLRLLDAYRAALGASDLRATVSEIGVELAQLGLRIALAGLATWSMLAWAEKLRASALRLAPVTPPGSPELQEHAAELRRVTLELQQAENGRRPARTLVARQAALEASIRRLSRHAAGWSARSTRAPRCQELARALGGTALLELIELDGALTALALVGGRLTRHELGPIAPVKEQLEWLRFALARLARPSSSSGHRATQLAGAQASATALDRLLIAPLADTISDRPLLIVPTGTLHALPWSMLPALRARPLVIAPSASTWLSLHTPRRRRRRKIVLVAGPHLRHGNAELAHVGAFYQDVTVLSGRDATVSAVLAALDGATVAHLACHGHFRSDSPLFSSLSLADGPLNAYELQRVPRAPELIVLSACDLAISDTRPGDELLGFAAALIGMGARTVIASVVPVPDAAAKRLMIGLHRHLTAGHTPAVALAIAQKARRPSESALAGFVCLGDG
jgi:hypothetical protein